jgi:hypothetical protein
MKPSAPPPPVFHQKIIESKNLQIARHQRELQQLEAVLRKNKLQSPLNERTKSGGKSPMRMKRQQSRFQTVMKGVGSFFRSSLSSNPEETANPLHDVAPPGAPSFLMRAPPAFDASTNDPNVGGLEMADISKPGKKGGKNKKGGKGDVDELRLSLSATGTEVSEEWDVTELPPPPTRPAPSTPELVVQQAQVKAETDMGEQVKEQVKEQGGEQGDQEFDLDHLNVVGGGESKGEGRGSAAERATILLLGGAGGAGGTRRATTELEIDL